MDKIIIRDIGNIYKVKVDSIANSNDILDIWLLFTSHLKLEETHLLNENDINNLNKYIHILKLKKMHNLLVKYKNESCTDDEYEEISTFINKPIIDLMNDRLTKKELDYANDYLNTLDTEEKLKEYISTQKDFKDLDVVEAYILYHAKDKLRNIINSNINKKIKKEKDERNSNLIKSLNKDYNFYKEYN